ncbi:MAG: GNAT family N-acetyltransferase [Verrucomicrobiales bacterium]|nr:GNAT family N-acetyltransferase [Verrucomicrobiales bacterium]|tara:strand:+ start:9146 stop:9559 length:414 start_codon:yes stop_codon:yes gene_type:complete
MKWRKDEFIVTDERNRIDAQRTGELLRATSWADERPQDVVERCIQTSLNFGMFAGERQVGYARLVSDFVTQAYLSDVVIEEALRGKGLGSWLLECILNHPDLNTCRIDLVTADAHEFYRKHGFGTHCYDFLVHNPKQ